MTKVISQFSPLLIDWPVLNTFYKDADMRKKYTVDEFLQCILLDQEQFNLICQLAEERNKCLNNEKLFPNLNPLGETFSSLGDRYIATPVEYFSEKGRYEIVYFLKECGASLVLLEQLFEEKLEKGFSFIEVLRKQRISEEGILRICAASARTHLVEHLVAQGAEEKTALMIYAEMNYKDLLSEKISQLEKKDQIWALARMGEVTQVFMWLEEGGYHEADLNFAIYGYASYLSAVSSSKLIPLLAQLPRYFQKTLLWLTVNRSDYMEGQATYKKLKLIRKIMGNHLLSYQQAENAYQIINKIVDKYKTNADTAMGIASAAQLGGLPWLLTTIAKYIKLHKNDESFIVLNTIFIISYAYRLPFTILHTVAIKLLKEYGVITGLVNEISEKTGDINESSVLEYTNPISSSLKIGFFSPKEPDGDDGWRVEADELQEDRREEEVSIDQWENSS